MTFDPLDQIDTIAADLQTLSPSDPDLQYRLAQIRLIVEDAKVDAQRFVPTPAVVAADESAMEVLRVFSVQGHFIAGVRWVDGFGPAHWAGVIGCSALSVGGMAEEKGAGYSQVVAMEIVAKALMQVSNDGDYARNDPKDSRPIQNHPEK